MSRHPEDQAGAKSEPQIGAAPLFLRRRDTAALLAVSESVVLQWERAGLLPVVTMPGIRAQRHAYADVVELAARIRRGEAGGDL